MTVGVEELIKRKGCCYCQCTGTDRLIVCSNSRCAGTDRRFSVTVGVKELIQ